MRKKKTVIAAAILSLIGIHSSVAASSVVDVLKPLGALNGIVGTGLDVPVLPALPGSVLSSLPGLPQLPGIPGGLLGDLKPGEKVIHKPFLKGFPDGEFHPDAPLTRAEAATIVAKVKELRLDDAAAKSYEDVDTSHWAYRYIASVTKAGYMRGFEDGSFQPNKEISRAELLTLILNIRGIVPIPNLEGYKDTENHWAKDVIATAKKLGIVSGPNTDNFLPDISGQRREAAVLFCIAFVRGPLSDGDVTVKQHFPDVPSSDWAFKWIEEAAVEAHESIRDNTLTQEKLIRYRSDVAIID